MSKEMVDLQDSKGDKKNSLSGILNTVNNAIKNSDNFDWEELDKIMLELHAKLTEPKWAIEDEALRDECEKLLISYTAKRYLSEESTK